MTHACCLTWIHLWMEKTFPFAQRGGLSRLLISPQASSVSPLHLIWLFWPVSLALDSLLLWCLTNLVSQVGHIFRLCLLHSAITTQITDIVFGIFCWLSCKKLLPIYDWSGATLSSKLGYYWRESQVLCS